MDSNQVAKSLSNDVLKTVYSMGAYNKEQLFKILAAKKIQSWYRKKLRDANQKDEGEGFSMAGVLRERNTTMSLQIRMILKEYNAKHADGLPKLCDEQDWDSRTLHGDQEKRRGKVDYHQHEQAADELRRILSIN